MWPTSAAARRLARFDAAAERLAEAFWPGPLTLVLPKASDCPVAELATAGLDSIAVRVPDHPVARDILAAFGRPVVAPSANRSGHVSPTTAQHVLADLRGRIDLIVDGGADAGRASNHHRRLPRRAGAAASRRRAARRDRARARPPARRSRDAGTTRTTRRSRPASFARITRRAAGCGSMRQHVAPGEALLAFGPVLPAGAARAVRTLNLSARGDLIEAAANLFSHLRALDAAGAAAIAVMPVPHDGLGEAINDRLMRARPRRGRDVKHRSRLRYSPRSQDRECCMNIVERPVKGLSARAAARFAAIVGERYALTDPADIEPYMTEERGLYHGRSPLVLRPGSTAEVSAILKLANETGTPIVPQGGNTGLVGGQTPHDGEVVLSLKRSTASARSTPPPTP